MLNRSGAYQFVICKDMVITNDGITKIYCEINSHTKLNAHGCKEQLGFFSYPIYVQSVLYLVTCSHEEDTCVKHSDIKTVQYLQSLVVFNRLGCLWF